LGKAQAGAGSVKRDCLSARSLNRYFQAAGFERISYFFGAREGTTDICVLGTAIERDQSIAVLAVRLKSVTNFLRSLSEYLRAFRAFDFYFFVNHGMPQKAKRAFSYSEFKGLLMLLALKNKNRADLKADAALI
jgi:hypothetical protein